MAADFHPASQYANLTRRFMDGEQWDRAMASATQWLAATPDDAEAQVAAARCHLRLKRYPEARKHLYRVLRSDPRNDYALRLLAIASFEVRDYADADRAILDALALDPRDAWHWYQLGSMCQRWQDMEAAKVFLREAESLAPREAAIIKLQALCEPECTMERLRLVRRALELNPEDPALHEQMGKFYFHVMRDFPRAEECYRQALALDPTVKSYRAGLFAAVRHRDWVYACLSAPGRWVKNLVAWSMNLEKLPEIIVILTLPLWFHAGLLLMTIVIVWSATLAPLAATYEWLTLKDIAARAGELGNPKRRWYLIRTWPLALRMAILTLSFAGIWTWAALWHANSEAGYLLPAGVVGLVIVYWPIWFMSRPPAVASSHLPLRARPPEIERLYCEVLTSHLPRAAAETAPST